MGFRPIGSLDLLQKNSDKIDTGVLDTLRRLFAEEANHAMDIAAMHTKRIYNRKRRPIKFEVGDKVYLRLYKGYELPGKPSRKWSQQRMGPFKILERVGPLAYKLDLPAY